MGCPLCPKSKHSTRYRTFRGVMENYEASLTGKIIIYSIAALFGILAIIPFFY